MKRLKKAINLYSYWRRYLIYRRLKSLARKELACMKRAKIGIAKNTETAQEYAGQLNSYMGLAKQWHCGYRLITPLHYLDGRIKFKISKDRIREETANVYNEELKKQLAISKGSFPLFCKTNKGELKWQ